MQHHIFGGFWEPYEIDIINRRARHWHNRDRKGKPWMFHKVPVLGEPMRGFHYVAWRSDWIAGREITWNSLQWMLEGIEQYYRERDAFQARSKKGVNRA